MGRIGNTQLFGSPPPPVMLAPPELGWSAAALRRELRRTRRCEETHDWSTRPVRRPTLPSTGLILAADWNRCTDRLVPGPKFPSVVVRSPTSVSHRCSVLTSEPLFPSRQTRWH